MNQQEVEVKFKHFDIICRFCLKKDYNLTAIFPEEIIQFVSVDDFENESISEMIKLCTGIKPSIDDKLPKNLCITCLQDLTQSNRFRLKCLNSQKVLEDILKLQEMHLNDLEDTFNFDNEAASNNFELHKIECKSENDSEKEVKTIKKKKKKSKTLVKNTEEIIKTTKISKKVQHKKRWGMKKGGQCQICGKIMADLPRHIKRHSNRHTCVYCNKSWKTLNGLQRHMNTHRQHHKCSYCGLCFSDNRTLRDHTAGKHTLEAIYECKECGEKFFYAKTFRTHKRKHNKDYNPHFECNLCPKVLTSKENLRKHQLIHTGEKPYRCEFCPKAFARSENLRDHRRVHTKEKPFVCRHCGSAFTQKSSLNLHTKKFHLNNDTPNQEIKNVDCKDI